MEILKPNARFKKITDIDPEFLKENNIKGLILDVDNTLITLDKEPLENVEKWILKMKESGFKICIASNSIHKIRVKKKAMDILGLEPQYIAEIGDQVFTDVMGANRMQMFTILTDPISPEKLHVGRLKRRIEKRVLKDKK